MPTIDIDLSAPRPKVHAHKGDKIVFETPEECTISFSDSKVFHTKSASTKNKKLNATVAEAGMTTVSLDAAASGSPIDIIVP